MKKYLSIPLAAVMMVFMFTLPGQAEHYHGGGGAGWWPVVGLGLGLSAWELSRPNYYAYPYYSEPQVIIQQQSPDVYIQTPPQYVPAPTVPETNYWYFCREANGYYP